MSTDGPAETPAPEPGPENRRRSRSHVAFLIIASLLPRREKPTCGAPAQTTTLE